MAGSPTTRSATARTGRRPTPSTPMPARRHAWAEAEITWGVFGIPESSLGTLGEVEGLDVVELGCGTAYVSAWLARRGARPVGVDVTPAQLATARRVPGGVRARVPARRGERRGRPAFLRELRPRGLRVRRQHLVRPPPLAPRGAPAAPARAVGSGSSATARSRSSARPTRAGRANSSSARSAGCGRSSGPARSASSGSCLTASCSACCGGRLRRPRPDRAASTRRCGRPHLLRHVLGRVGKQVAGRGDLGRARSARDDRARARLDLASAACDPRAAAHPVRRRRAGLRRARPARRRPVALVRGTPRARRGHSTRGQRWRSGSTRRAPRRRPTYGKPADTIGARGDARRALAGRTHEVVSGLCLLGPGWAAASRMRRRTSPSGRSPPTEIERYLAAGEWEGRAGSYAIQGLGARLVARHRRRLPQRRRASRRAPDRAARGARAGSSPPDRMRGSSAQLRDGSSPQLWD